MILQCCLSPTHFHGWIDVARHTQSISLSWMLQGLYKRDKDGSVGQDATGRGGVVKSGGSFDPGAMLWVIQVRRFSLSTGARTPLACTHTQQTEPTIADDSA